MSQLKLKLKHYEKTFRQRLNIYLFDVFRKT